MTILLVPDLLPGHGTGHLRRCSRLLRELPDSAILIPEASAGKQRSHDELAELLGDVEPSRVVATPPSDATTVILDRFSVSKEEVLAFAGALTVGVDVGGEGREYCSYVVDLLPRLGGSSPNLFDPGLLHLPDQVQLSSDNRDKILVTFGGEDPAGLTEKTAWMLVGAIRIEPSRITIVRPSLRTLAALPDGVTATGPLRSLTDLFRTHAWVICSHGLSAYEASAAGRSVITVAPRRYHDRLARRAGFLRAGVGRPSRRGLRLVAGDASRYRHEHVPHPERRRLFAGIIRALSAEHLGCPVHDGARGRAIWRNEEKSYFRCPVCGVVYLERFRDDREEYGRSYFDEEYRSQYGKTYLEDFDAIKRMGLRRLDHIGSIAPAATTVLDIGCAYGPFLDAARERGLEPHGADVSDAAISHVREKLRLPAVVASALDLDCRQAYGRSRFDVVTLWYVIEHFADLSTLLDRVSGWVPPGGVFAFSTPSFHGVSGRRNRDAFLEASPRDHHVIFSPSSARAILGEYGFTVRRVVSTGHHPERYPAVRKGVLPRSLAGLHSRIFRWGDTFEVYAVRDEALGMRNE